MPGFTAWAGLKQIGAPKPGETIAVAAATGPVGATVGQIGKLSGCRVVGIAGGPDKCAYAVNELGFDACIDHKAPDFAEQLAKASPDGIDVYFENVGGKVLDAVIPLLNPHARVPVCGLVSQYNATELPAGPDRMNWLMGQILRKKIRMQGFIIFDSFRSSLPRVRQGNERLGRKRKDQISRGNHRWSGKRPGGLHRSSQWRKLRQARDPRRSELKETLQNHGDAGI